MIAWLIVRVYALDKDKRTLNELIRKAESTGLKNIISVLLPLLQVKHLIGGRNWKVLILIIY